MLLLFRNFQTPNKKHLTKYRYQLKPKAANDVFKIYNISLDP